MPTEQQPNERYDKLQKMLNQAKQNNLDAFYRNLDQGHQYPVEQKFNSKQEFNHYRNELKAYKREREDNYKDQNGTYNFRHNKYQVPEKDDNPFAASGRSGGDFVKKAAYESDGPFGPT